MCPVSYTHLVGLILVFGLGFAQLGGMTIHFATFSFNISGLFIAVVIGVLMNAILPNTPDAVRD